MRQPRYILNCPLCGKTFAVPHKTKLAARVEAALADAQERIRDPQHWIKGNNARTGKRGMAVAAESDEATTWCAVGTVKRTDGPYESLAMHILGHAVPWSGGAGSIFFVLTYNDKPSTKHPHIMALFDKARALALAKLAAVTVLNRDPPGLF